MNLFRNILLYTTVAGIFILHPSLNKGETPITYLQYIIYGNSINLSYNSSIDKNEITIEWECENQKLDCIELTIIKNGKKVNQIPFEQGNQKLVVYYKNNVVGKLHQNKSMRNQSHKYTIDLKSENNTLTFKGKADGPSPGFSVKETEMSNSLASL
jgi:hypothetical protein